MSIAAVIFDFNGVLVDDESLHCSLFMEVLALEGITLTEQDYHQRYLGYDDRKCFETVLGDSQRSASSDQLDQLIARKAQRYAEIAAAGGLRFFTAAADTLQTLAAHWPVAICSGALRTEIEYSLARLDCLDQVTAIISAEDTTKCKPDPEGFQLALAALRRQRALNGTGERPDLRELSPSSCLVIEDSLAGIVSAKGAGMWAVGVPNTYAADELFRAGADDVVDGLANLTPGWIKSRFA
jgi:beta-phosphoglucomutase-like phosphatase (HAD superfamily)